MRLRVARNIDESGREKEKEKIVVPRHSRIQQYIKVQIENSFDGNTYVSPPLAIFTYCKALLKDIEIIPVYQFIRSFHLEIFRVKILMDRFKLYKINQLCKINQINHTKCSWAYYKYQ